MKRINFNNPIKLLILIVSIFFAHSSYAAIFLTSPSSSSVNNSFTLSYSINEVPNSGTVSLVFTGTSTTRTLTMSNSQSVSFSINPTLNLASTYPANIIGVTGGSTIPDGTYTVSLSYINGSGTVNATPSVGVVIDTVTTAPTLTSPSTGSIYTTSMPIQFSLPESALSGSRKIVLTNASDTVTIILKDSTLTDFTLDLSSDPISNSNVQSSTATSIPSGTYNVSFSYQDLIGNPIATTTSSNVVISNNLTSGSSGGYPDTGCGMVVDQKEKKNSNFPEFFILSSICLMFVISQRKKYFL